PSWPVTDELYRVRDIDPESLADRGADAIAQRSNVSRTAAAIGDDEVGVERADAGSADAQPLQAGRVDEAACMVARRVAEDAPGVLVGERLGRHALGLVLRHQVRDRLGLSAIEGERRRKDHLP